jgi:hypothetical protein
MSLQSRLASLITVVGGDIKSLTARVATLELAGGGGGGSPSVVAWKTGDPDPASVPAGTTYILMLSGTEPLPLWTPTGRTIVIRS